MKASSELVTPGTDVRTLLDSILSSAIVRGVSDIHVEPTADGYEIRCREDGMLAVRMSLPADIGRGVVLRLMVLAHLLTYRLDVPQEGRAAVHHDGGEIELRISIMPTIHGLRAAVRLPGLAAPRELDHLGLDHAILVSLQRFARGDTGMLIVTGPAGSGKTTTIYALLAYLAINSPGVSIVSLEDPVERAIAGITQIEVKPFGQLTYEKALRSILRQDPQILMLGEIRDAATAQLALQAAMTGHRLITTLHASSAAGAIARLLEMGLEPYQVTSAVWGVLAQRLVRKNHPILETHTPSPGTPGAGGGGGEKIGTRDKAARDKRNAPHPNPPPEYQGRGYAQDRGSQIYSGRTAVGELLLLDANLRRVVLEHPDIAGLDEAAMMQTGFVPLRRAAEQLIQRGITDPSELTRLFGD